MILEYKLVVHSSGEELSLEVSRLMSEGWELYAGPCVALSAVGARYTQALILRES